MKLENSVESVKAAKKMLGMPENEPVGFKRMILDGEAVYTPMLDWKGERYVVGDEIPDLVGEGAGEELAPLGADIFDVYGEYPHVHPTSVEKAVAEFRELWSTGLREYQLKSAKDFEDGTTSVESRAKIDREWMARVEEVQIRLARRIMASGEAVEPQA